MQFELEIIPRLLLAPGACLANLDGAALKDIQSAATRRVYQKGQIICLEGDPCPGVLLIESGWIKGAKFSPQGREQGTRLAGPGEMINDISVMSGSDNLVTLIALEESALWVVRRADLLELIAKHPTLSQAVMQNLVKESANLLNLVEDLALRPVHARLAHLILDQAHGDTLLRQNWYTEAEIANSIGTTSEIISRVLNEMKELGTIRLDRHKLTILDRAQLERMAFEK